jgi:hypothetical protein
MNAKSLFVITLAQFLTVEKNEIALLSARNNWKQGMSVPGLTIEQHNGPPGFTREKLLISSARQPFSAREYDILFCH